MPVAYPYVEVKIDDKGLTPTATRAPGVVAVVGVAAQGPDEVPIVVDAITGPGGVNETYGADSDLGRALSLVLAQSPSASKVYGLKVKADTDDGWKSAFSVLEGVKDVTLVGAANRPIKEGATVPGLLRSHVVDASASGSPRIGVSYVDTEISRGVDGGYVANVSALVTPLKSDDGRFVVFVARGAKIGGGADIRPADVAAASMSVVAGLAPETSILLKQVKGFSVGTGDLFAPTEIKGLAEEFVVPVIDPEFIPGTGLYFGEGKTLTGNPIKGYVDLVRLLDDVDFSLKANLIGLIGDSRITRSGLYAVQRTLEGVLDGYVLRQAITSYRIVIDLLPILEKPEATWTENERKRVKDARADRVVSVEAVIVIGPAIHRIVVALKPFYAMPPVA